MSSWLTQSPQDPKREHRLIPILQFIHTQIYKYCFGKPADGLERSVEGEDECESPPWPLRRGSQQLVPWKGDPPSAAKDVR